MQPELEKPPLDKSPSSSADEKAALDHRGWAATNQTVNNIAQRLLNRHSGDGEFLMFRFWTHSIELELAIPLDPLSLQYSGKKPKGTEECNIGFDFEVSLANTMAKLGVLLKTENKKDA